MNGKLEMRKSKIKSYFKKWVIFTCSWTVFVLGGSLIYASTHFEVQNEQVVYKEGHAKAENELKMGE